MDMRGRYYSIREVEELLGIPRTKIRHYLDKGLLEIERDEENGYYLYRYEDLLRISQIVYYRDVLGYSIEETVWMLNADSAEKAQSLAESRIDLLRSDIRGKTRQLSMLEFNRDLIMHQHEYRDKFSLIPCDTMYSLPYAYFVMTKHPLWSVMYGGSEYSFDGETLRHERLRCVIFERDLKYLPEGAFKAIGSEAEVIKREMAVYTVSLSSADVRDPNVIKPVLHWATKHRFRVIDPIYVTWFYPFSRDNTLERYLQILMPIDIL